MEKLPMCRICLATNARMNVLCDTYLQEIYEELTAISFVTTDKRPTLACYMCSAKLRTCYQLKMKCLQSEMFFRQILESDVTKSTKLEYISRTDALKITPVEHFNMGDEIQENELQSVHVEVKEEPPEIEVIVKQEVFEDNENEFRQEYNITLEEMPQTSPVNFTMDTCNTSTGESSVMASVNSEPDLLRVKSEGSTPTLAAAENNSTQSENVAVISNTKNNEVYDKEKLKLGKINSSYNCPVCQKCFNSKSSLVKHNCKHTAAKQHQCDVCFKYFSSTYSLRRHNITAHNSNKSYKCDICGKSYVWLDYLKKHVRQHENLFHQCQICKKMFSSKDTLQIHSCVIPTNNSTNKSYVDLKFFTCDICKRDFNLRSTLINHLRTHTGEKPYQCDVCKKSFSVWTSWSQHVLVHNGKKPFQCDLCYKVFKRKGHLKTHNLLHTGEKPLECEVCSKRFNRKVHLKEHMRVHTGEKPYPCELCDKRFGHRSSIKTHMMRAHKVKNS